MNQHLVTVIQARTGSTRLPGKVLMPLAGEPLLVRMVERVKRAKLAGTVVVATTTEKEDDPIEVICKEKGWHIYRGHESDLLDRHYQAAKMFKADAVAKIPSDCPLIDPSVIDKVLSVYFENHPKVDFVSNLHPPTYPDGNDVEVMRFSVLETAWKEASLPMEREHTTPFIWERPERFKLMNVSWETGLNYSMTHRWTIDYPEDYAFINRVYDELYKANPHFGLNDILNLLESKPEIFEINSKFAGVNWYRNHLNELKTIDASMTKNI
ncbi:MAG: glycosyltransferase family protein [Flavobacteriales bacterium]|nr:glycosyltransferase family protein [Flavobacteriales bacterium]